MAVAIESLEVKTGPSQEGEIKDGFNLTLTQLVDSFFPESSFADREEMGNLINQCNDLLSGANLTYFLSALNILPFVKEGYSSPAGVRNRVGLDAENPQSQTFNLNMKLNEGPTLTFYLGYKEGFNDPSNARLTLLKSLTKKYSLYRLDPEEYGLKPTSALFKIPGDENMIGVKPIDNKSEAYQASPILILEKTESAADSESVELKIAVETNSEKDMVRDYSRLRTLFTIRLKSLYSEDTERIMFSDYYSYCQKSASGHNGETGWIYDETGWIFNGLESQTHITGDAVSTLISPLSIDSLRGKMLDSHIPYTSDSFYRKEMERKYLPMYYLNLLLLSARLANLAINNGDGIISEADMFGLSDEPVLGILSQETKIDFEFQFIDLRNVYGEESNKNVFQFYSPIEFLLYENLWMGRDIWKDLDNFYLQLTEAVEKDPENFWRFLITIGLDNVFPAFKEFQNNPNFDDLLLHYSQTSSGGMEAFCKAVDASLSPDNPYKRMESESIFEYWTRLINLLPDISTSRDWRPSKEKQQSDLYFMKLCKALGAFAVLKNEQPSGAILVKDDIRGYAHDQVNLYVIKHHRDQAIAVVIYDEYVDTADEELEGYRLYTLIEPDLATAEYIRYFNLAKICCGISSNISPIELKHILASETYNQSGFKPPPAEIIMRIPEMEEELFDFLWRLGFQNMPDYLVQKYIQINEGGYDEKTAQIYTKQMDELMRKVGSIEQEMLLEWLGPNIKGKKILDTGCGSGNEVLLLYNQEADVYGIDGSEEMIRQAQERYPEIADRFQIGYVTELPSGNEMFDIIMSKYVINELSDPDAFFKQATRCLKPGGTLIFFAHHPQSQMEFSRTDDYFRRGPVETILGDNLSIIEPQHQLQDYLSEYFTDSFILARFMEGQDPALRMHPNKNYPEMLVIKAIKK